MISRRGMLIGALGGIAALTRRTAGTASASQPATPVRFKVPAGACDCHTHVFGDPARFPMAASRTYTPETASVAEMRALHRALRIDRVVVVQPSVYATENACTLDAVRRLGKDARGIAVINDDASDAALDAMHRGGIRGVRLNLATGGQTDPAVGVQRFQAMADRVRHRGWLIQIYAQLAVVAALADRVAAGGVPVVFDHFGGAQASAGVRQPGFDVLVELVRGGHAYVKISAPYRSSSQGPDYPDVAPLAGALIAANPRRILWGTDWPHPDTTRPPDRKPTDVSKLLQIDDGRILNQLETWAPDADQRKMILVDNPAALFGF